MSDIAAFCLVVAATIGLWKRNKEQKNRPFLVDRDNKPLSDEAAMSNPEEDVFHRATYILVMHDPPEMFYEPKEWSHTSVLLCRRVRKEDGSDEFTLPSGVVHHHETYVHRAAGVVQEHVGVDVSQPENSLHHLFTFPYEEKRGTVRRWADFMECVYRGSLQDLYNQGISPDSVARMSLGELKDMVMNLRDEAGSNSGSNMSLSDFEGMPFPHDTYYAMRLYFQRQGDLRAKRRLMKSYSSEDLEHYQLHKESKIVFLDDNDQARNEALDFTMKTDDGQSPYLLFQADLVLLGVSRAGKTPVSLILSQTMGLKVANIPLVLDIPPPPQLFKVSPKRVFCLTPNENELKVFRKSRLRRELRNKGMRHKSTYADTAYVRKDLENAKKLVLKHNFTEINVSGRAIEETASLIASKIKERFPDMDIGTNSNF